MEKMWCKIDISKEQVAGGVLSALQDKFTVIYNSHNKPKDFACFFVAKNAQSSHTIYLSPKASIECEFIINTYSPEECDQPNHSPMGFFSGNKDFPL